MPLRSIVMDLPRSTFETSSQCSVSHPNHSLLVGSGLWNWLISWRKGEGGREWRDPILKPRLWALTMLLFSFWLWLIRTLVTSLLKCICSPFKRQQFRHITFRLSLLSDRMSGLCHNKANYKEKTCDKPRHIPYPSSQVHIPLRICKSLLFWSSGLSSGASGAVLWIAALTS